MIAERMGQEREKGAKPPGFCSVSPKGACEIKRNLHSQEQGSPLPLPTSGRSGFCFSTPLHNRRFGTTPAKAWGCSQGQTPVCLPAPPTPPAHPIQGSSPEQAWLPALRTSRQSYRSGFFPSRNHQISLYIAFLDKLLQGGFFFFLSSTLLMSQAILGPPSFKCPWV